MIEVHRQGVQNALAQGRQLLGIWLHCFSKTYINSLKQMDCTTFSSLKFAQGPSWSHKWKNFCRWSSPRKTVITCLDKILDGTGTNHQPEDTHFPFQTAYAIHIQRMRLAIKIRRAYRSKLKTLSKRRRANVTNIISKYSLYYSYYVCQ